VKKFLIFLMAFLGVLLVARSLRQLTARAEGRGGAATARANGDTNGDGVISLSDAIYLIDYLVGGGPAPVALAQDPVKPAAQWPPRPQDIVNVDGAQDFSREEFDRDLKPLTLYSVPSDKWLVITDFSFFLEEGRPYSYGSFSLVEILDNQRTVKRGEEFLGTYNFQGAATLDCPSPTGNPVPCQNPYYSPTKGGFSFTGGPFGSTTGLAFRPRSSVSLSTESGAGPDNGTVHYTLTGYLADP
jgi:hypothetical protein